jgi:hypothetical protein
MSSIASIGPGQVETALRDRCVERGAAVGGSVVAMRTDRGDEELT